MTFKIGFYRLQSGHVFNEKLHCCYERPQRNYRKSVKTRVFKHVTLFY